MAGGEESLTVLPAPGDLTGPIGAVVAATASVLAAGWFFDRLTGGSHS